MSTDESRPVRLSCRHVWKVFGDRAETFFPHGGEVDDVDALIKRMTQVGLIAAACDVGFDVQQGEIFVIMGLSGSGKSTIVRCLSRLVEPTAGSVLIDEQDVLKLSARELIEIRRHKMGDGVSKLRAAASPQCARQCRLPAASAGSVENGA